MAVVGSHREIVVGLTNYVDRGYIVICGLLHISCVLFVAICFP